MAIHDRCSSPFMRKTAEKEDKIFSAIEIAHVKIAS